MVELFSYNKCKLELQTYGLLHTRNFSYHVLVFRALFKIMEQINELIEVLKVLGYEPKHNEEKRDVYFTSFGFEAFPEKHKKVVRALLGKRLSEFYYGGINTQHIYYRAVS